MNGFLSRKALRVAWACGGLLALIALWRWGSPQMLSDVAYLAPAMLGFVLLWSVRYPGERLLIAHRRRRRARVPRTVPLRSLLTLILPRGGSLLAGACAGRAPPNSTDLICSAVHAPAT